jgi:parvulin-like peptidyl-prolyl isomerase
LKAQRSVIAAAVVLSIVPLCAAQPASPVIARAGNAQVTLEQLEKPLIDGYGLNILLNLIQLELVKQQCTQAKITVTPADIAKEHDLTVENMFKGPSSEKQMDRLNTFLSKNMNAEAEKLRDEMKHDNEQALEQFLANQHLSRVEFDIIVERDACLRKIAEPLLVGKISEQNLQDAFNTLYGATVKCRHIQCANMQEIQEAKRRLANGEPFAKVATEMSRNPSTGPLGGELPPFSLQWTGFPQTFKDAAFALKEGEVSDIVHAEGSYHLILLEKKIPPKAVKFEDVKESLREDLQKRAVEAAVKEFRQQLSSQAMQALVIEDPVLKKQWDERLEKRKGELKNREEIMKQKERERNRAVTQPTTSEVAPAK